MLSQKLFNGSVVALLAAGVSLVFASSAGAALNEKRVLRKMGGAHKGFIEGRNLFKTDGHVTGSADVDRSNGRMKIPVKQGTAKTNINDPDHGVSTFKGRERKLDVKRNGKLATGRVAGSMMTPGGGEFKGKLNKAKVIKRGRKTTASCRIDSEADHGGGHSTCFKGTAKGKGKF